MDIVVRLFPGDINAQHTVAVCVLELLYTLNCAVRLLPLLAKAHAVWLLSVMLLTEVWSACNNLCGWWEEGLFVSDVIDFRLEQVIIPRLV